MSQDRLVPRRDHKVMRVTNHNRRLLQKKKLAFFGRRSIKELAIPLKNFTKIFSFKITGEEEAWRIYSP